MTEFWSFVWRRLMSCWIISAMSSEIQESSHKSRSRIINLYLLTWPICSVVDRQGMNIFHEEAGDAPLREPGKINITFTPRVFPTPTRESLAPEEEAVREWVLNHLVLCWSGTAMAKSRIDYKFANHLAHGAFPFSGHNSCNWWNCQ